MRTEDNEAEGTVNELVCEGKTHMGLQGIMMKLQCRG